MSPEMENWALNATNYFKDGLGLDGGFARQTARLFILLYKHGLNPQITSGFRDPGKQKRMQQLWDAGQRAGLRARPASISKHTETNWIGKPAAKAVDMKANDEKLAAKLAQSIGIGSGLFFASPDPGHYYAI